MHPTATLPATRSSVQTANTIVLLWTTLLAYPVSCALLMVGDQAISSGVRDLDELHDLILVVIAFYGAAFGLVSFVLAIVGTLISSHRTKDRILLASTIWTATTLVGFTAWVAYVTVTDLGRSTTAGDQFVWQLLAALVALLPLVVNLAIRRR